MRTLHFAPLIGVALLVGAAFAQPPAEKVDLLNFAKGDLPNDTGSDKKTYSLADQPGLGKCLKVDFPAGDSVGVRLAKVTDWKRYATVEFDAFNPGKNDIKFGFNVAHRRSTNYHTRIEAPFTLKPGKSRVRLGIGHPGHKDRVTGHVLGNYAKSELDPLADMLGAIAAEADWLARGDDARFMSDVALRQAQP